MATTRGAGRLALGAIALALLQALPAQGAEWRITPTLDLRETWTDNVAMAPRGSERSDFVTEVNPGLSLSAVGPRLKLNANYVMRNFFYARGSADHGIQHQLNALANAELVEDLLYLDGQAAISNQSITAFGPQAPDSFYLNGNRSRVSTHRISPYLVNHFEQNATSVLRFANEGFSSNTSGLANAVTNRIDWRLDSGPAFRQLGWGVQYVGAHTDYNAFSSLSSQTATGRLRYRLTDELSAIGSGGFEKYNYSSNLEQPDGPFWNAGFAWTPSERTRLEVTAGHRFYGGTYAVNGSARGRNTVWSLNYSEDITTAQSQFLMPVTVDTAATLNQLWSSIITDPLLRQQAVDAYIRSTGLPASLASNVNMLTNRIFLQKRWQASVALNVSKSTMVFGAYSTRREAQSGPAVDASLLAANQFLLDANTRQDGVNGSWSWRLAARTGAYLNAGYGRIRALDMARRDNNATVALGLNHQFQPRLKGSLELRHLRSGSNVIGDTRENAIRAWLSMQL